MWFLISLAWINTICFSTSDSTFPGVVILSNSNSVEVFPFKDKQGVSELVAIITVCIRSILGLRTRGPLSSFFSSSYGVVGLHRGFIKKQVNGLWLKYFFPPFSQITILRSRSKLVVLLSSKMLTCNIQSILIIWTISSHFERSCLTLAMSLLFGGMDEVNYQYRLIKALKWSMNIFPRWRVDYAHKTWIVD